MKIITASITMSDSEWARMTKEDRHLLNRLAFEYRRGDLVEMHFNTRGFVFDTDHEPWVIELTEEDVELTEEVA